MEMEKEIEIIYENNDLLVINKPAGLVVHPDLHQTHKYTIVNWLVEKYPEIQNEAWDDDYRPGIVHRLDKDTSGLMIIAKTRKAYDNLKEQIKNHQVEKRYYALVLGKVHPDNDIILTPIGRKLGDRMKMSGTRGKEARTEYQVIKNYQFSNHQFSLLDIKIISGRTHQIRVHMKQKGNPLVGDKLYAKGRDKKIWDEIGAKRQFLHAYFLKFKIPGDLTKKAKEFKIDLAHDLKSILEKMALKT